MIPRSRFFCLVLTLACIPSLLALNLRKAVTQYSRTTWTQQDGLLSPSATPGPD